MNVKEMATTIRGVKCELELNMDDAGKIVETHCYLNKGRMSASLELLQELGGFEDDNGNVVALPPDHIAQIQAWADKNGY